jgi:N-6 DNA Methylase
MKTINRLLRRLGITEESNFYYDFFENTWKKNIPIRLKKGIEEIKPNGLFIEENKIIALFFDFSNKYAVDLKKLFEQIWNMGGLPIIFVINSNSVDIYNGYTFDTETLVFDRLKIGSNIITEENLDKNFSIWDIFSGKSFEGFKKPKSQVDNELLKNLVSTKNLLVKNGLNEIYAQNVIGRLVFSRYLLDRNVHIESKFFTDNKSFLALIRNRDLLYSYFDYLKETFNGDLFPVDNYEKSNISDLHLNYLFELFSGSDIFDDGFQRSLFDIYDFNIIPIELISEVYERFMGEEKQRKKSAYYTPSFLVDYILKKTLIPYLESNKTCKVFDPSCGSGIFLVESLRNIIEKNLDDDGSIEKQKLKSLLSDNIYGVDDDENAINLTAFSLYLTLLDYVNPKDVTNFKFPPLKGKNLFKSNFFDTNHSFNEVIKDIDFILGNPPWGSKKEEMHVAYINKLKNDNNYNQTDTLINHFQIAQSFVIRTKDFSSGNTKSCFILPSTSVLYNPSAKHFRKYWLDNFAIHELLELSPVRDQLFVNADAPTSIVFFAHDCSSVIKENIITHTSVKPNIFLEYLKLIVIEKTDEKHIKQSYFQKYDWLWKTMLYGNVLDFYLIKRLKEDYSNLNQLIEKFDLPHPYQGFQLGGGDNNDASHLLGKLYLDTKRKFLSKFFIMEDSLKKWEINFLHRPRTKEVYQPPYVLLKKGFPGKDFSLVSAYSEKEFVFTDSITAIRGKLTDKRLLKSITGCLNSNISSYYLLMQGSSAGVEREQGHNKNDRFKIPIAFNNKISTKVDKIHELYKKLNSEFIQNPATESELLYEENKLNIILLNSFEFSKTDKALLDYALKITIPQINKNKIPSTKATIQQLKSFAKIFIDHFGNRWKGNPNYFSVDIYYNEYVAGMNFNLTKMEPKKVIKFHKNKKTDILFKLMEIGEEKIANVFYKQRDIRGFNNSSFYLVKTNQYKNWHPAIAYGDLAEFIDAMLDTGRKHLIEKNKKHL